MVGSVLVHPDSDRVRIRVPVSRRAPFEVTETEREITLRIYGAVGDVDWMRYGPADSLVRRIAWGQPATDEVTLTVELARPVWGYRARWDRNDLLLDIRRPPAIDRGPSAPGPAHRGGSRPPARRRHRSRPGLREAEANLAVALELRRLLEAAGRPGAHDPHRPTAPWTSGPASHLAEQADADVLVSIHNNALPDGVNPFTNNGTSVYYNQPRSIPLARAVQAALVRRLGLRDLGIGRGDLALVRPTWMPSVLTEGLVHDAARTRRRPFARPEGSGATPRRCWRGCGGFFGSGPQESP